MRRVRELEEECKHLRALVDQYWRKWSKLRVEKCLRDGIEPYPYVADVKKNWEKYEGYI